MPRPLVLTTSTNNTASFVGSLYAAGYAETDVDVLHYDQKFYQAALEDIQKNPSAQAEFQQGQRHIQRDRCAMDEDMLRAVRLGKPDAVIYISSWQGDFVPINETLGEINAMAPLVHFLSDGADPPWWPQLKEFDRRGTFSLTVNIDGSHAWPGGKDWRPEGDFWNITKTLTLLTPVDTRHFPATPFGFAERPYAVGYAGNRGGHFRQELVNRLNRIVGFQFRERDGHPQSYPVFADFLRHCRVSVSTPFTGSGAARQVKGRVLETGFAGACLLEWKNEATRSWFAPRAEYWEFESMDEAVDLAEWLVAHPRIAGETAAALHDRVVKEHAPKVFWDKVMGAIER